MSRPVFHESSVGVAMVVWLGLLICLRVYALVMGALCYVHFVFGPMLYVWCSLYESYSADRGCRYLWVLGMDKRVKSLFEEHAGCDLVFFDGDFCLCRVSYSLRWLLMSNGSCSQMHF